MQKRGQSEIGNVLVVSVSVLPGPPGVSSTDSATRSAIDRQSSFSAAAAHVPTARRILRKRRATARFVLLHGDERDERRNRFRRETRRRMANERRPRTKKIVSTYTCYVRVAREQTTSRRLT